MLNKDTYNLHDRKVKLRAHSRLHAAATEPSLWGAGGGGGEVTLLLAVSETSYFCGIFSHTHTVQPLWGAVILPKTA